MITNLLYLNDFSILYCEASITEMIKRDDKDIIVLNQTVFYPQGGGQPYDVGVIKSPTSEFSVAEVRMIDSVVNHIGKFTHGQLSKNESVKCIVNKERRELNNRLHSAGHVVDMAIQKLGLNWIPGKGHHFPSGPYVEYAGSLDNLDKENLKLDIANMCNQLIQTALVTKVIFVDKQQLKSICRFVPDYIIDSQSVRLVYFGDTFAVPCGGTHVANLLDIKNITIRKIKMERSNIRVSYDIAE